MQDPSERQPDESPRPRTGLDTAERFDSTCREVLRAVRDLDEPTIKQVTIRVAIAEDEGDDEVRYGQLQEMEDDVRVHVRTLRRAGLVAESDDVLELDADEDRVADLLE